MDWSQIFAEALSYNDFLDRYATPEQRKRWDAMHERIRLTEDQEVVLRGFCRKMPVLVLNGAWCGDCINQCPIFHHFARVAPNLDLRFLDRDARDDARTALMINGGQRVPVVVWFGEDFHEVARFGDRTLAAYCKMAADQLGPACPSGVVPPTDDLLAAVIAEWLGHFERVHLILRLSGRLREKYGD
jgi:thiol-disulfide isomerase/thioredoxin